MRLLNYTSHFAVFFSYVITGLILSTFPGVVEHFYSSIMARTPLPGVTLWLFAHVSYPVTFILELILGLGFFSLLICLERGDASKRAYLPGCMALTLNLLQLILAFTALFLPMFNFVQTIQS